MNPELDRIYHADHTGKLAPALLKEWPENFLDACVTDPPYELDLMGKAWDSSGKELSGTYLYMSAAERVIQAMKWPAFKEYTVTGPAADLVAPIVMRQTGGA